MVPWWAAVAVGTLGAAGAVTVSWRIGSGPRPVVDGFWPHLALNYRDAHVLFYLATALLALGWLGVGVHAVAGRLGSARAWTTLALWGTPLALGTPLFSRDPYSYVALGQLARRGLNPFTVAPAALGPGELLSSIALVWRHTTSPYGPLFVELARASAALSGSSLLTQVLGVRALALVGVVVLMVVLPRLARDGGVDPGVARWLAVLSPLALYSTVSTAHNDTLMLAGMMLALLAARRGWWRGAVALFALAATIKLPALAGTAVVTVALARDQRGAARWRTVAESATITAAVLAGVTWLARWGWGWLSPAALRIPTELRVLTTPSVDVAHLLVVALHAVGVAAPSHAVVTAVLDAVELAAGALALVIVARVRRPTHARALGVALLVVALGSPTLWPWYLLWGITALAVTPAQRSRALAGTAALAMWLVGPGGSPMIGGNGFYVAGPLVLGALVWYVASGRWRAWWERP
jgi:alpha-1,6-mannosyltransferase